MAIDETKYLETLRSTLNLIETGMKSGMDNLELILDSSDWINLGPEMIEILNKCEIEYKQGNRSKIDALRGMIFDYSKGKKEGIRKLIAKYKELTELSGYNTTAKLWLADLNQDFGQKSYDPDITILYSKDSLEGHFKHRLPDTLFANDFTLCDPAEQYPPPSNTWAREFSSNEYINKLYEGLAKKIITKRGAVINEKCTNQNYRNDLLKLKEISADKFAYTRAEILGMLDLYKGYRVPVGSE